MVQAPKRIHRPTSTVSAQPSVQRAEKKSRLPVSPLAMRTSHVQTKLRVNAPGDKYEQEADAVSQAVAQSSSQTSVHSSPAPLTQPDENRDNIQRMPADEDSPVQHVADEEKPIQRMPEESDDETLQRKGVGLPTVSATTAAIIRNPGTGSPLPPNILRRVEPHVRANLSGVRVHTDARAQRATANISARAFTHRNHIFLGSGESSQNVGLMAHELTHVVQQGAAPKASTTVETNTNTVATNTETLAQSAQLSSPPQKSATQLPALSPVDSTTQPPTKLKTLPTSGDRPPNAEDMAAQAAAADSLFAAAPAAKLDPADMAPRSPAADPAFQKVTQRSKGIAKQQQKHAPASTEAQKAQAAAVSPASELTSQAQNQQVKELDQQEAGTFSAEGFVKSMMEKVAAIVPKNEKKALDYKNDNKIEKVKQAVAAEVKQEKAKASSAIATKTKEAPSTQGLSPRVAKPLSIAKAGPKPTNLNASQAAPKAKTHTEVTQPLQQSNDHLHQQMTAAAITDEQLANANEPQFTEALSAKQAAKEHSKTGPEAYRQTESELIKQAETEAQQSGQKQTGGMHTQRGRLLSQVGGQQEKAKGQDEQARAKVAKDINGIYESTKSSVTSILEGLDTEVNKRFDVAAKAANLKFKDVVAKGTKAFEENRYGAWYSISGLGKRIYDKLRKDLPPELNAVYVRAREVYVGLMKESLHTIGTYVATQLNKAKQKIADGKKKIGTYVSSLSPSLRKVGEDAAASIQNKFDQLGEQINSKQGQLVDSLAKKYTENLKGVEAHLTKLREENQGLLGKAAKYVKGVWKTIQNLREMLLGILAKAAHTIDVIVKNPIRFLKLLLKGIKQGFNNFVKKLPKYIKSGLIGWLTGALGPMGITMPKDVFSLSGIFSLVTQVLDITWAFVRRKAVKLFGEKTVSAMEKSVKVIQILMKDGTAGLWKLLKDKFQDLKKSVLEEIQSLVVMEVIKAGVKSLLGLLNPVSAFVKAAMLIYDVVMFFVNQGSQMVELLKAVVDAVSAVASGNVKNVAKAIEGALARSVPVLIGFLAALLGIGGLAKKVQAIVKRIRKRIEDAIDKLLLKVKKIFKRKKTKGQTQDTQKLLRTVLGMVKPYKNASKKQHKLDFERKGKDIVLYRKSIPSDLREHLERIQSAVKNNPTLAKANQLPAKLSDIKGNLDEIERIINEEVEPIFLRGKKVGQKTTQVKDNSFSIANGKSIKEKLAEIADSLAKIPEIKEENGQWIFDTDSKSQERPQSKDVCFTPTDLSLSDGEKSSNGEKMIAPLLSRRGPSNTIGSQPNSAGYSDLYLRLKEFGRKVVAAHLLNHQLFGKGNSTDNLAPIPSSKNTEMESAIERPAKDAILRDNKVISYTVNVKYKIKTAKKGKLPETAPNNGDLAEDLLIPDKIKATITELKPKKGVTDSTALKQPQNWKTGPKIKTKTITQIRDALAIGKGGGTKIDYMTDIRTKMDRALTKNINLTWTEFWKSGSHFPIITKIIGSTKHAGKPQLIALKEEFVEKKSKLGGKGGEQPVSYEMFLAKEKIRLARFESEVQRASTQAELQKVITKVYAYYYISGGFIKQFHGIKKKSAKILIQNNLNFGGNLKGLIESNTNVDSKKLKRDISDAATSLFVSAWEKRNKKTVNREYQRILEEIESWQSRFNQKNVKNLEGELQKIEREKTKLKTKFTPEQRGRVEEVYSQAKTRLETKLGTSQSDFQEILGLLQGDLDNLSSRKLTDVIDISNSNLASYLLSYHEKKLKSLQLSPDKQKTLEALFKDLASRAASLGRELIERFKSANASRPETKVP